MLQSALVIAAAVTVLAAIALRKGVEGALGCFAFLMVLLPVRVALPLALNVTPQRAMVWTLLVCYLMESRPSDSIPRRYALHGLIALQMLWYAVSTWNSVVPETSFKSAFGQIVEYFPIYYILTGSLRRTESVDRILRGVVGGIFVCCCLGVVESYTGWNLVDVCFPRLQGNFDLDAFQDIQRGQRIGATYPHPILYGTALASAYPMALYLLSRARSGKERVLLWAGLALMALNLFKTVSRGPWIVGALSVLCYGLLAVAPKTKRTVGVLALLAVAVCLVRPGVWQTIADLFVATYDHNSPVALSYEYREHLWTESMAQLATHPERALWGFGKSSFYSLGLSSMWDDGKVRPLLSCDSSWIEILMDTGWIGLAITGALLLKPLRLAAAAWRRAPREQRDRLLLLSVALGGYYLEMVSVAIYSSWCPNVYMLWMLLAMATSSAVMAAQAQQPARRVRAPRVISIGVSRPPAEAAWERVP